MLEITTCDTCGKPLDSYYNLEEIDCAICKHCNQPGDVVHWIVPNDARTPPVLSGYTPPSTE